MTTDPFPDDDPLLPRKFPWAHCDACGTFWREDLGHSCRPRPEPRQRATRPFWPTFSVVLGSVFVLCAAVAAVRWLS